MKQFSPFLNKRPNKAIIIIEAMHRSNSHGIKEYMKLHRKERLLIESVIAIEMNHV